MNGNETNIFEEVNRVHYANGLRACAVYSKDGNVLGTSRMDHDAAEAMVSGMKAMAHAWTLESDGGNHLEYVSHFKNNFTGVKVGVYR